MLSLLPILIAAMVFAAIAGTDLARRLRLRRVAGQARAGRYDGLADTIGGLIVQCDRSGSVIAVSSNCEAFFGVPPGELMGRGFFERVQVADRPAFLKTISDARAGAVTVSAALRWRGAARVDRGDYAEPVFLCLEMRARRGGDFAAAGEGYGNDDAIAIIRDVTEAKQREAELDDARAAAAEATLGKEYFLTHAGHELRTPLNAIVGFSELLADPRLALPDVEKQREYARIIHQSGLHLIAVVNSILNISKIQSNCMAIEREPFAVAPLVDLCCDMVKLHAQNSGVELLRAYPENLDEITGDKRACTQILVNLLSNAIKFTPPNGTVTISVRPEPQALLIVVADTGIGIAARDLARLGDLFFQAKTLTSPNGNGTGLGLSIVRGLVGLQGGTIGVASEPAKGTCVHVRLPLDGGAAKTGVPAKIQTIPGPPIPDRHGLQDHMTVQKIA
jgi:two-component system, cell cycle sensor histidine kinase DivJ